MAACVGHFATTCFEHVSAYISGTARDNLMKFDMYTIWAIHIQNKQPIDMVPSGVKGQKTVFRPFLSKYLV